MNIYTLEGEYKRNLEIQVIGALMIEPRIIREVMGKLNESDFDQKPCAAV
jgi:hypothetical protein